jgi:hypothetical protein
MNKNLKGGRAMEKEQTLEKVGELRKGDHRLVLWRSWAHFSPGGYCIGPCGYFIEEAGEIRPFQAFVEPTLPTKPPTPELLEEFVEERLKEGYELQLEAERKQDEDLKGWYGGFLSYLEDEEGELEIDLEDWKEVRRALAGLDVLRDDFAEYWALPYFERDILWKRFVSWFWKKVEKGERPQF